MASIKFIDRPSFRTSRFKEKYDYNSRIFHSPAFGVKVKEELPFRVRFTSIGVPSYGNFNVPPIGIAIIGFNNYIL
jgi:hypothetical protein